MYRQRLPPFAEVTSGNEQGEQDASQVACSPLACAQPIALMPSAMQGRAHDRRAIDSEMPSGDHCGGAGQD